MARVIVLGLCLGLIALLAFLTFSVAAEQGINGRVILSAVILAILGIGVIGAIGSPPDE